MHLRNSARSVEHFLIFSNRNPCEAPPEDSQCDDHHAELYCHMVRIRAATSMRICFALRSEALGLATGQVALSKN